MKESEGRSKAGMERKRARRSISLGKQALSQNRRV
jgi:hypothetical protein